MKNKLPAAIVLFVVFLSGCGNMESTSVILTNTTEDKK